LNGGPSASVRSGAKTVVQALPLATSRPISSHLAIAPIVLVLPNMATFPPGLSKRGARNGRPAIPSMTLSIAQTQLLHEAARHFAGTYAVALPP
jgi:hypothetical protein